ncbi:hypothetical protein [sulfur-oxidizing endosymbiont of Gigantopelta aegis]|uniref:hypothetical protein n=1 Tax=sulfur-oxidizing endosymbiont of Gigantopelta aegis TaxID=2794934 RepID=UPI0018DE7A92|nr:hypothetical protein [sulfur-oxidizing endosymbiont of Gigantopelta aegis]
MKNNLPLAQDKKLTVLFRLESGCLGPEGESHIEKFCQVAKSEFATLFSDFVYWDIIPRRDKSLPEMQYLINNKKLNQAQAAKFLALFDVKLPDFEHELHKSLTLCIDRYLGH